MTFSGRFLRLVLPGRIASLQDFVGGLELNLPPGIHHLRQRNPLADLLLLRFAHRPVAATGPNQEQHKATERAVQGRSFQALICHRVPSPHSMSATPAYDGAIS